MEGFPLCIHRVQRLILRPNISKCSTHSCRLALNTDPIASNTIGDRTPSETIRTTLTVPLEATLLSSQIVLEVDGLLVKTAEDLRGFALPFSDHLYGAFKSEAAPWIRFHPEPKAYFYPALLKDMQRLGVLIRQNRATIQFVSSENSSASNRDHVGRRRRGL